MIEQQILGFTPEGEVVIGYTMTNAIGAKITFMNIGAAITSVIVPDKKGTMTEVLLGFDNYNDYFKDTLCRGRVVGRYAGRIAKARFDIDGVSHKLSANEQTGHLNGGLSGFQSKIWTSRVEGELLVMGYISPDGEEGYPSEFGVEVGYEWNDDCTLGITIAARGENDTIANIVPYLWFNLNGENIGSGSNQELTIKGGRYPELNMRNLPTGKIKDVKDTPFDFTKERNIKDVIDSDFDNMPSNEGYDNYWLIDDYNPDHMSTAATLLGNDSGIKMTMRTSQPAVYMAINALTDGLLGRNGEDMSANAGVLLTSGNLPDAPNQSEFGKSILKAGEMYHHYTSYTFTV